MLFGMYEITIGLLVTNNFDFNKECTGWAEKKYVFHDCGSMKNCKNDVS